MPWPRGSADVEPGHGRRHRRGGRVPALAAPAPRRAAAAVLGSAALDQADDRAPAGVAVRVEPQEAIEVAALEAESLAQELDAVRVALTEERDLGRAFPHRGGKLRRVL